MKPQMAGNFRGGVSMVRVGFEDGGVTQGSIGDFGWRQQNVQGGSGGEAVCARHFVRWRTVLQRRSQSLRELVAAEEHSSTQLRPWRGPADPGKDEIAISPRRVLYFRAKALEHRL
jgi:hypothetical protein